MTILQLKPTNTTPNDITLETLALILRIGLGSVFIIGGIAKLRRLLDPALSDGILAQYMGPLGYINQTFQDLLFAGPLGHVLSPFLFLSTLSAFELVAGVMLVAGLMVRPLALVWALLLWSFVFSLPVVTTPGVVPEATTYSSPALLVQVRDVTLSGLFVALYRLGPGRMSLDAAVFQQPSLVSRDWNAVGTLLRYALALTFLVGGVFHGFHKIATFGMPAMLLVGLGLALAVGVATRFVAILGCATFCVFLAGKIPDAAGLLGYFNSVKRELALLAASATVALAGGGRAFSIWSFADSVRPAVANVTAFPGKTTAR